MKLSLYSRTFAASLLAPLLVLPAMGATTLVNDNFTAANVGSGFALGQGLNSAINPPTSTRLTGTLAGTLRYLKTGNKNDTAYTISGNKANITTGTQSGRFTLSADGATPYDFAAALGTANASPTNPVNYDITISMNNKVLITDTSVGRMSFGFGTTEAGAGNWNFGIQIVPQAPDGTTYNIIRRIRIAASGLASEVNATMTNAGVPASEISFLCRVTDAGAESSSFSSRVQVSLDGGATFFYDTQTDSSLTNGWRFDAPTRFFSFDQAANGAADTYDNFSVTLTSPLIWTGSSNTDSNWSTGPNWLRGVGPALGGNDTLVFAGATQTTNNNDLSGLAVASITFSNSAFSLGGNGFSVSSSITNGTGTNVINNDVTLIANTRLNPTAGTLIVNGGILSTGRTLTVSGAGTTVINGVIATSTGTLTKQTAAGALVLNGTNTYTGTTTISQGLLAVNGSIASPSVALSASGTLGGTGVVLGTVSVTGTLAAGNGIGTLSVGGLTLNNNGTNSVEISSVAGAPGSSWDFVDAGVGNVDVQAVSATPFKFRLTSLGLNDFDKDATYSWPAMGGTVLNYSADKFQVLTTGFTNDLAGGAFSVETNASGLALRFLNNRAPVAGPTNYTLALNAPFSTAISNLLATVTSDPDGDARALVALVSTNAVVATNATDLTITSTNGLSETILYVVQDVRNYRAGDTVRMATNAISITVSSAAVGGTLSIAHGPGNASITLQGSANHSYVLQYSPDLSAWSDILTNTTDGSGALGFNVTPPTNPSFYRTRPN